MKIEKVVALIVVVGTAAVLGCSEAPRLTEYQVDQLVSSQQSLAEERVSLGKGRDELEADRRQWSERQRSEPIIAQAIGSAALLLACCLPVVVAVCALRWHRNDCSDSDAVEALLLELDHQSKPLLPGSNQTTLPALEDQRES